MKNKKNLFLKIFVGVSYLVMIGVNYLANALPIAGKGTGVVSDSYPNLFAPAGITFVIWGLIYLLLTAYIIYYLTKKDGSNIILFEKVAKLFILSSLANAAWLFCWHYGLLVMSVILMAVILISLILIASAVNKEKLNKKEKLFLRLPFSIYFGWITVATIANISALLVKISWTGWGLTEVIWTVIILLVGAFIGILRSIKDRSIPYILVFIWAYFGIWFKHYSPETYNSQYPLIMKTAILAIALFVLDVVYIALRKKKLDNK